ncbi:C6 finger domain-containing protein [Colletotrichum tofieldiae]|uniref:C6 finger domain-containing protein n=1 Tax=Colletotrichum tofieldiae TaxID=708197 RepID=A0A166US53_9PEZI|nr:C6 finger domain-containing protein [Colletotrichum tofieldiae]
MNLDFGLSRLTQSDAAPGVSFCEVCNKPFTNETALKRHLPYCRRTRTRPRVRPRPCRECSTAKCKCSLQPRCARCTKKGLDCVYPETTSQVTEGHVTALSILYPSELEASSSQSFVHTDTASFFFNDEPPWGSSTQSIDPDNTLLLRGRTDLGLDFASGLEALGHNTVNITDMALAPEAHQLIMSSCINNSRSVTSFTTEAPFPLNSVCTVNPVTENSANLIRRALRSYPQMMIRRSSFPPFIHPYQDKSHLPEPLANCMSIAVLFASRNRDTRPFLWKAIRDEQERNLREMINYTKHEVFAALQAEVIYIIMRVVDGGGTSAENRDYNMAMLFSYAAFWKQFMMITDTPCNIDSGTSVSWEDWILNESRTRIACVWFLIAQIAFVKVGIGCVILESWKDMPLPCHKAQWSASTPESWKEEMDAFSHQQISSRGISSFGELLECHRAASVVSNAEKLDAWNSGADNIGNLLNLATTMM